MLHVAAAALAREAAPRFEGRLAGRIAAGESVTAREVYEAFAAGEPLALAVHAEVAEALAHAIGGALALLAPDLVVLGGGVLAGAGALVRDVAALVPKYVYPAAVRDCRFEGARLGPDAGLLGAALYGAHGVLGKRGGLDLAALALPR